MPPGADIELAAIAQVFDTEGQATKPRSFHPEHQCQLAQWLLGDHLPAIDQIADFQGVTLRSAIDDAVADHIVHAGTDLPQDVGVEVSLFAAQLLHDVP
ncbi:hypothetical protein D3C72_2280910 [compost metagenome]